MRTWSMASSPDVVEYICFQLRHAGDISFKKMFGEYGPVSYTHLTLPTT